MGYIKDQLLEVKKKIADAALAANRKPEDVKLIAVSKTFPVEDIVEAYNEGHRFFGENKTQELEIKNPVLASDVEWHMIGHLQSNKAVKAVMYADYIHSVDSVKLLRRLDRLAGDMQRCPKILLEVNVSGERSKNGLNPQDIYEIAEEAANLKNLKFTGLMTMAPFDADENELHSVFGSLRKLRDELNKTLKLNLTELSMGMSGDFEIAIAEGATMVRVGTAIFGRRTYQL